MGAWPAVVADVLCVSKCNSTSMLLVKANIKTCTDERIGRGKYFLAYTVPSFCL